jgi:hypothetical protein
MDGQGGAACHFVTLASFLWILGEKVLFFAVLGVSGVYTREMGRGPSGPKTPTSPKTANVTLITLSYTIPLRTAAPDPFALPLSPLPRPAAC